MKYLRNYNTKTRKHKKNGGGHCSSAMCNNVDTQDDAPDDTPIGEIRMYTLLNNENTATIQHVDIHEVSHLPKEINRLRSILVLNIYNCTFSRVPDTIGELTTLTYLRLTNTQITRLPDTIGQLTNLHRLYLQSNQLTSLPKEIGNLTQLTDLNLSLNRLTSLPKEIGNLTNLRILNLEYNRLTHLPKEISNLTNLRILNLEHNQLSKIHPTFSNLTNLTGLELKNNPWKYPINIEIYYNLPAISSSRSDISDINQRIMRNAPRQQAEMVSLLNSLRQPLTIQNDISGNPLPKGYVSKKDRNQIGLIQDSIKEVSEYLGWNFLPEYKYRIPNYYTRRILTPAARSATYARRRKEISENLPRTVDNDNLEDTLKRMEDIDKRNTPLSSLIGGRRSRRRSRRRTMKRRMRKSI